MTLYFIAAFFALSIFNSLNAVVADEKILVFEKRTPNGRVERRFSYYLKGETKIEHGRYELYYKDGQLMTVINYQHGMRSGLMTTYYKWINKRSSEEEYKNDRQHGLARQWSPQGELLYESKWENGAAVAGRVFESGTSAGLSDEYHTAIYENGIRKAGSEKTFNTFYERPTSSNQLPDFQQFIRWNYPTYEYGSTYRFQYRLPLHREIPDVLAIRKTGGTKGETVIDSQLETLTRFDPEYGSSDEAKQTAWENWWTNVGVLYPDETKVRATQDLEAWRIACKGRTLPIPETPVVLPRTYSLTFTFHSGDYRGICKEKMTLKRTSSAATLRRTYSTSTYGDEMNESWQGMSIKQADTIARAIAHVIDHPWLQNNEFEINRVFWENERKKNGPKQHRRPVFAKQKKLLGRESFSTYYASAEFEMKDGDGNVWWNADPNLWYGANEDRYNWSSFRSVGGVYSFFIERYPESKKSDGQTAGWKED